MAATKSPNPSIPKRQMAMYQAHLLLRSIPAPAIVASAPTAKRRNPEAPPNRWKAIYAALFKSQIRFKAKSGKSKEIPVKSETPVAMNNMTDTSATVVGARFV
jgi:hypothetical protein